MKENKIKVEVVSQYVPEQSSPENHRFIWSYDIKISNESDEIIQLLNRYWRITDMRGKVEEVRAPGVIGLQPIIKPGKDFTYTSYCQLTTPQGAMEGHYEFQNLNDVHYIVDIAKFALICPASASPAYRSQLH